MSISDLAWTGTLLCATNNTTGKRFIVLSLYIPTGKTTWHVVSDPRAHTNKVLPDDTGVHDLEVAKVVAPVIYRLTGEYQ